MGDMKKQEDSQNTAVDETMDVFNWQRTPLTQEELDEVTAELRF